jgi:hypothetical protein
MKLSELAGHLGMSARQLRRWVAAGCVPCLGTPTKGGHFRFRETPQLRKWITEHQPGRAGRMAVAQRAYEQGYKKRTAPKRTRPNVASKVPPVQNLAVSFTALRKPFSKIVGQTPMHRWTVYDLKTFISETEWIVSEAENARRLVTRAKSKPLSTK